MDERTAALGEIALDVLQRIARELLARKPGGHLIEPNLEGLDLRIALPLRGPEAADPEAFSRDLVARIDELLDDLVQQAAVFRPGHAFCHRDASAACEHSEPPSARHVFVGYGPTGVPRWEDFAQYCLDARHPDVDQLYEERPAFLTLVQEGPALRGGLLEAFQTPSYELLGQVMAGFYPVRTHEGEGRGVLALTFQVAASRFRDGRVRLGLNVLGRTPTGEGLGMLWERQGELPWRRALLWAQAALASVVTSSPARIRGRVESPADRERARARLEMRVGGILRGLARRLERDRRARSRRTTHAEQRHESGERPTRKAIEDTRGARPDAILVDERSGTLVVLGDRGRTHFFSPQGRLVSSVRYSKEAVEKKRKLGLWRDASEDEALGLIKGLTE